MLILLRSAESLNSKAVGEEMSVELTNSYNEIIGLIEQAKNRVNAYVNRELIDLYWAIGGYVSKKVVADGWGKQTVKSLADFLSKNYPDVKGFSTKYLENEAIL